MKYREASGWVMVIGPPELICCWNKGITEPEEPSTFPKRTMAKRVCFCLSVHLAWESPCVINSAIRLVAPMILLGRTALSVEIRIKLSTFKSKAALATL